ncbi:MAG: ATP-dependent Clp protease proteolytic subunit [Paraclostridium sp.]
MIRKILDKFVTALRTESGFYELQMIESEYNITEGDKDMCIKLDTRGHNGGQSVNDGYEYHIQLNEKLTNQLVYNLIDELNYVNGVTDISPKPSITPGVRSSSRIVLHIACPGGVLMPTFALVHTIQNSKIPIDCVVTYAHSAATLVVMACRYRSMLSMGDLGFHDVHVEYRMDRVTTQERNLMQSQKLRDAVAEYYIKHSKMSREAVYSILNSDRDWYKSADECLELGIIDKILEI